MTDLTLKQQTFVKNYTINYISKLAENLSQIKTLCAEELHQEFILNLAKESRYFIEWTVPDMVQVDIDSSTELVDLGRVLTRWLFSWDKIRSDSTEKIKIAQQAEGWFKRVLEISELLSESISA